jgi:hypothetical protein
VSLCSLFLVVKENWHSQKQSVLLCLLGAGAIHFVNGSNLQRSTRLTQLSFVHVIHFVERIVLQLGN